MVLKLDDSGYGRGRIPHFRPVRFGWGVVPPQSTPSTHAQLRTNRQAVPPFTPGTSPRSPVFHVRPTQSTPCTVSGARAGRGRPGGRSSPPRRSQFLDWPFTFWLSSGGRAPGRSSPTRNTPVGGGVPPRAFRDRQRSPSPHLLRLLLPHRPPSLPCLSKMPTRSSMNSCTTSRICTGSAEGCWISRSILLKMVSHRLRQQTS